MKYKTYNNMLKATQMIADKGYDWETANELAINCFDKAKSINNGMDVEWFIDKIADRQEQEVYYEN